ncbi:MAG: type III polyketide synthase [Sphingopyxis sp.]|jgi:predicted naringenin-chalcone synthase|nr:type III polyketide synthase [Sphingopyxis sp.]
MAIPCRIEQLATARPAHNIHAPFITWATGQLDDPRERQLFARMAARSGIAARWSVLPPAPGGGSPVDDGGYYARGPWPPTSERMASYAEHAPALALAAIAKLTFDPASITHIVVASCTGFVAPGIDQIIARALGLSAGVERLLIGFMGCYAGVTALRAARHIVRSDPAARVLVISVELSTLHLENSRSIESLLAMLQFSDGAAAAIVSAGDGPVALGDGISMALPQSDTLIRWDISEHGFVMRLSGEVPAVIEAALGDGATQRRLLGEPPCAHLAVHAGGRSILDAVERALALDPDQLGPSRAVLADCGNMSSATILFVIERMIAQGTRGPGLAIAFGPGLAAEAIRLDFAP